MHPALAMLVAPTREDELRGSVPVRKAPPQNSAEERRRRGQRDRREQQDKIFNDWFPEADIRAASGDRVYDDKHLAFTYPGLSPEDPAWLDPMIEHLRQARTFTLRHIEVVRIQADRLLSEATLVDNLTQLEVEETMKLIHTIGRMAGPEFLTYIFETMMQKLGLQEYANPEEAAFQEEFAEEFGDEAEINDDDDDDDVGFDYINGLFFDDEERGELAAETVNKGENDDITTEPLRALGVGRGTAVSAQDAPLAPQTPPSQIGKRPRGKRQREESPGSGTDADNERTHKRQRRLESPGFAGESPSPTTSRVERISSKLPAEEEPAAADKGKQPVYPPGSSLFWAQRHAAAAAQPQEETHNSGPSPASAPAPSSALPEPPCTLPPPAGATPPSQGGEFHAKSAISSGPATSVPLLRPSALYDRTKDPRLRFDHGPPAPPLELQARTQSAPEPPEKSDGSRVEDPTRSEPAAVASSKGS